MKLRIIAATLAAAGLLATATPASAQVYYGTGYTPYSGTITPAYTYTAPGVTVTTGGYAPYTAASVYNGYYSGFSPYTNYSTLYGTTPYYSSYGYSPYYGYSTYGNYGYGYGRRGLYRRW